MNFKLFFVLSLGVALLSIVLLRANLSQVASLLGQLSFIEITVIFLIFLVASLGEAGSWLLTLKVVPFSLLWLSRFWRFSAMASTLELATPFGLLGTEPLKAVLLKRRYGVAYQDAVASLFLTRTTDALAILLFVTFALALTIWKGLLPQSWLNLASVSLVIFTIAVFLFVLLQRLGLVSRLHAKSKFLQGLQDVEKNLGTFYKSERLRLLLSIGLTIIEWILGAVATWASAVFLGQSLSFSQAAVIEAFMLLATSALFFIPGHIGSQEGAFVLATEVMLGSASLGLALAAIKRARDILWALMGLALVGMNPPQK